MAKINRLWLLLSLHRPVLTQFSAWETLTESQRLCLERGIRAGGKVSPPTSLAGMQEGKLQGRDERIVLVCVGFWMSLALEGRYKIQGPYREPIKAVTTEQAGQPYPELKRISREIMSACVVLGLLVTSPGWGCVERWEPPARKSSGSSLPKLRSFIFLSRGPISDLQNKICSGLFR